MKKKMQEMVMRMFDVQGIEIVAPRARVFAFLREAGKLPHFFFSSIRRHTRSTRDWSSDVCPSDLHLAGETGGVPLGKRCTSSPTSHSPVETLVCVQAQFQVKLALRMLAAGWPRNPGHL